MILLSSNQSNHLKEVGTKPPSQTKEGLEFEFFLKFQSFLLRVKLSCSCMLHIFS